MYNLPVKKIVLIVVEFNQVDPSSILFLYLLRSDYTRVEVAFTVHWFIKI